MQQGRRAHHLEGVQQDDGNESEHMQYALYPMSKEKTAYDGYNLY